MVTKTIFITGASSGIGLASTRRLLKGGFRVIAGVYPGEDLSGLDALPQDHLTRSSIDITKTDMIAAARDAIRAQVGDGGLYGLFNNAGIALPGPIEFTPMAAFRQQFDVNMFGHIEVTQMLLPLIRQAQGRIVNTVSILGRIALAFSAPYCMSKFAMQAFTDSLRQEMALFGVHVAAIEPGVIKTAIWEKATQNSEELADELPPEGKTLYGKAFARMIQTTRSAAKTGVEPDAVAERVYHAFTAKKPRTRYLVGSDAHLVARLRQWLSDRLLDAALQRRYPTK